MTEEIVNKISAIRVRNNSAWMALLELALEKAPEDAKAILAQILENDRRVCDQMERLLK